jgi:hypothetical protein
MLCIFVFVEHNMMDTVQKLGGSKCKAQKL